MTHATPMNRHPDPHVQRVIRYFESFGPRDLPRLAEHYASGAHFKDPFNDVHGVDAITRVFRHMFDTLEAPRFRIRQAIGTGADVVLTWDFDFALRGRALFIHGASHLRFDVQGRIVLHRDYWDAAEELYERLPVLGWLMRALRRRLAAPGVGS
jgi:limonene-1,2-epoxide hydrolase